jgi:hypothetical protein
MAVISDNLNNRSYGGLYVNGGAGTQNTNATPGVFNKVTQFATAGMASQLVVPSVANNNIKVFKPGIWLCMFEISWDPGSTDTYTFQIWAGVSGAETARVNITSIKKAHSAGEIGLNNGMGFLSLNTYDVVDLRVTCDNGGQSVAVKSANIIIGRFSAI